MSFARLLIAPALAGSAYASFMPSSLRGPRRLVCEAPAQTARAYATSPDASSTSGNGSMLGSSTTSSQSSDAIIDPHQFATGSIIGIVSGMLLKRLGRLFFIVAGGAYLLLRALGASQLIPELPWRQMKQFLLNRTVGVRETEAEMAGTRQSPVLAALTRDMTFKGSFLAMFLIGLINT